MLQYTSKFIIFIWSIFCDPISWLLYEILISIADRSNSHSDYQRVIYQNGCYITCAHSSALIMKINISFLHCHQENDIKCCKTLTSGSWL